MPELPEVETVVRLIRPRLTGKTLGRARFAVPRQLAPQTPREIARAIKGQTVLAVKRRGKYILIELEAGTLLVHLRMTGRLYVRGADTESKPHERIQIELNGGAEWLVLHDTRTLGTLRYFVHGSEIAPLAEMGWEPLEDCVDCKELQARLAPRGMAIKPVLLDQTLWAGIGNIYASEALWDARISPLKPASELTIAELKRLIVSVPKILARALDKGGSTLRDFADPDGNRGSYQREFLVYGREDEPCDRCGKPIVRIVQAQRSTYYCERCQKIKSRN